MGNFILTTDTSCDVFRNTLRQLDVPYVPLTYTIKGTTFKDEFETDDEYVDFYNKLRSGILPVTSQINIFEHEEFFKKTLDEKKQGDIIHLTLSSGLSNTYQSALSAAQTVMKEFSGRKIYVLDTLCATQAHRCVLDEAIRLRDNSTDVQSAFDYLTEMIPRINVWIIADDLMHLKRGGRVSGPAAYIGTMLNIKPVLIINSKGGLSVITKIKGMAKAMTNVLERIEASIIEAPQTIYLASADCGEHCQKFKEMFLEKFPQNKVVTGWIGPIIGSHTGAGTLGIVYKSKSNRII